MKMQVVDAPEKDVRGACAINQGRSKFEMRGLGLEEGTCSISLRMVYLSQSSSLWPSPARCNHVEKERHNNLLRLLMSKFKRGGVN